MPVSFLQSRDGIQLLKAHLPSHGCLPKALEPRHRTNWAESIYHP